MTFQGMPVRAKAYWALICLLGLLACASLPFLGRFSVSQGLLESAVFLALAGFAGGRKVSLFQRAKAQEAVSMSLGFVITFAGMLHFGVGMAVLLGVISCCAGCLFPTRQPVFQLVFNVAIMAIQALLGSLVYVSLNHGGLAMRQEDTFLAVACSTLTYYVVNTGGVSIIIGICASKNPFRVWRETFMWTAPSFFAGACISAVSILAFGHNLSTFILFLAPVGYFLHQSYSVHAARAEEKVKHLEEVQQKQAQLADLYLSTIKSLALAVDAKDQYTHQHILRVQRYAVAIAIEMGFTGDELEAVNTGALLHDIGKLGVPEHVLLKPGRLTEEEFDQIKKHPEIGAAILEPVEFPWPVIPVVKYHHEKWDGTGYPEGLKGEEIPLNARILAVADVYDALTSSRAYRSAWTHERALGVIIKDVGTHFDGVVVQAFTNVIDRVIHEMAEVGEGPLAEKVPTLESANVNARAVRDIARTSAELWALYEIAPTISAGLGLSETVNLLARKLEAIYHGSACLFMLQDEVLPRLNAATAVGPNHEFFSTSSTLNPFSRSWVVARDAIPYVGPFDQDDLLLASSASAQWTKLHSAAIVPLVSDGEVLGTINLYHADAEAFSSVDLERLELIASAAASAIHRGVRQSKMRVGPHDSVTGLPRIETITNELETRCASESPTTFALLCVDMESFKCVTDHFGAKASDDLIMKIAHRLSALVGQDGIIARYRWDDFLILLNGADETEARRFVQKIESEIAALDPNLIDLKLGQLSLRAATGVACFPHDGETCAKLLKAADQSLQAQKIQRKLNSLRIYQRAA